APRGRGSARPPSERGGYSQLVKISELVAARGGESLDLWARTINPQFARVLRTIGFDRTWARADGAYLRDDAGNRFLDLLGGFGMFNVGRNNPRVRAALIETLELDLPGSVQLGASPLPPLLAEELPRRAGAGQGRDPAAAGVPRACAGALPPLRHALLRRRGADRARPHRHDVRVRALGPRAGPGAGVEVALGRLRARGRAADVEVG